VVARQRLRLEQEGGGGRRKGGGGEGRVRVFDFFLREVREKGKGKEEGRKGRDKRSFYLPVNHACVMGWRVGGGCLCKREGKEEQGIVLILYRFLFVRDGARGRGGGIGGGGGEEDRIGELVFSAIEFLGIGWGGRKELKKEKSAWWHFWLGGEEGGALFSLF